MVKKYGDLYLYARKTLLESEGENAGFAARELLSLASGKTAESLISDSELYASEEIETRLKDYLARSIAGEPLAYILGQWSFCGLELTVTPEVLIPRDDTAAVTELAVEALRRMDDVPLRVLDLCTGSGCIGLAIAHQVEKARVTLADLSQDALKVAKKNVSDLKLTGRVKTFEADVMQPAPKFLGQFDLIVSNPPYVTDAEILTLQPSVRYYEPRMALCGGEDGLDFYRAILKNYTPALKDGGVICFEFGLGQETAVGELLRAAGYSDLEFRKDYGGIVRAVRAVKK